MTVPFYISNLGIQDGCFHAVEEWLLEDLPTNIIDKYNDTKSHENDIIEKTYEVDGIVVFKMTSTKDFPHVVLLEYGPMVAYISDNRDQLTEFILMSNILSML